MNEADRLANAPHPRSVYALQGHEEAEAALARALSGGRLHHGWLIMGPEGVGKATLAYRFIRRLLGAAPAPGGPLSASPEDPVCRMIEALSHPDFLLIRRPWEEGAARPKNEIPAEEARRLSGFFSLKPALGGRRVALIDAADDLNRQGANGILKALEEPPPGGVVIILAHSPGAVLPTIRSRCRRIMLRPVAGAAGGLAGGRPGRALALEAAGGAGLYRLCAAALEAAPRAPLGAQTAFAARAGATEASFSICADMIADWLARAGRAGAGLAVAEIEPGESAAMARFAAQVGPGRLAAAWEETRAIARQTEALNLDRVASILAMLRAIGAASGARAA